ncbi:MAG TPA: hypothetical protein PLU37_05250 [Chitinophagaceae bacterium]|nr:hypothetical protein [Chitinophagaceae bacterium]
MKIQLCFCFALLINLLLQAQAPKGPDGNALYKKGDCERAGATFSVCTYCEDKELTKNCKEYLCTNDGTCTEKPKKAPKASLTKSTENISTKLKETDSTTSKLPKGTKFENGKVVITKGYKAVHSSDKTMVFVMADNGLGVDGTFRCSCPTASCKITNNGQVIICTGSDCCGMVVTTGESSGFTMEAIEKAPEKLKWKKLIFPTK